MEPTLILKSLSILICFRFFEKYRKKDRYSD